MNPIITTSVIAKVLDFFTDGALSKGFDISKEIIIDNVQKAEFSKVLDKYDQEFKSHHDTDISSCNINMDLLFNRRLELEQLSKKYIYQEYTGDGLKRKRQFINNARQKIDITFVSGSSMISSSFIIETYLDGFYDLVLVKETKGVSEEVRALLNSIEDQISSIVTKIDRKYDVRVTRLESHIQQSQSNHKAPVDFRPFYEYIENEFTEGKTGEFKKLVGDKSDDKTYIDAYVLTDSGSIPALSCLEEWYKKDKSGIMLIYGEPGHGKSQLCNKAVVSFHRKSFLKGIARNVLSISLNTRENRRIIESGNVYLENALVWDKRKQHSFSFEDCQESLLFMDGFDEFIDEAENTNIEEIWSFMNEIRKIAYSNEMHIVVLSRTIAVQSWLERLRKEEYPCFALAPLTEEQQDEWLLQQGVNTDYIETFHSIRENQNMKELLGVPLLFRLIVHNRFDAISSNIVELYDNLFEHLMTKRKVFEEKRKAVKDSLQKLAYEIYCMNADTVLLKEEEKNRNWVHTFYVKRTKDQQIGFFHGTFYQYFLAKYIYSELLNVTNGTAESFIGLFAEREFNDTIRQYISQMLKKDHKEIIYTNMNYIVDALVRTEAYINLSSRYKSGDAAKSKIIRSTNVYRNTLHLAASVSYVIRVPFRDHLDVMIRTFRSSFIKILSEKEHKADLEGADLRGAYMQYSYLDGANLRGVKLSNANLQQAILRRVDMQGANLSQASLQLAVLYNVDLQRANLAYADLRMSHLKESNLLGTDLHGACLQEADLHNVILQSANLEGATLKNAHLIKGNLQEANLRRTDLQEANLLMAQLQRANLQYTDLQEADLQEADLKEANLQYANLQGADLSGADLRGANLQYANLQWAILQDANLQEAHLENADLEGADLQKADIHGAFLKGIPQKETLPQEPHIEENYLEENYLEETSLQNAPLQYPDIEWDDTEDAILQDANLSKAKIDSKYKNFIDPSIKGYNSIIWV